MQQSRPTNYLQDVLLGILTPGFPYQDHPTVLIGDQIPIYYGSPRPDGGPPAHVIPDCLVALDVDAEAIWNRVGYDPVQNGKPPDVVIEVASISTYRRDAAGKREIYRQIGVPEYWRLDPTGGDFHGQPIIGERLVEGRYEPFPVDEYGDGSAGVTSPILNLEFRWRDGRFHIHDPATGVAYEHPLDVSERMRESNAELQAEVDRLRAENRTLRGEG